MRLSAVGGSGRGRGREDVYGAFGFAAVIAELELTKTAMRPRQCESSHRPPLSPRPHTHAPNRKFNISITSQISSDQDRNAITDIYKKGI